MKEFINYIKQYIELSSGAQKTIERTVLIEKVSKGQVILKEGRTCNRMYFLVSGTARVYFYQKGKDITYWIYPDSMLFTSWGSYLQKKPSVEYIEAIEDSTLISLTLDDWSELYLNYPELERFGRKVVEEQMASLDDFYKGYYFLTAKEKYDLLLEVFPSIVQRANLGYIASMLGISQETLSRIRGK